MLTNILGIFKYRNNMNNSLYFKEMGIPYEKYIAIACGLIGGMSKYFFDSSRIFLNIPTSFFMKLFEAGLTAFVCGMLGLAGKKVFEYSYTYVKRKFKKKP